MRPKSSPQTDNSLRPTLEELSKISFEEYRKKYGFQNYTGKPILDDEEEA